MFRWNILVDIQDKFSTLKKDAVTQVIECLSVWKCVFSYIIKEGLIKGVHVMDQKQLQEFIIQKYQDEERTMVHLFIEWCRENEHDPHAVYHLAYPEQQENAIIIELMKELSEQEPLHIPNHTLLEVLQMFGNDELAFVITELIEKSEKKATE